MGKELAPELGAVFGRASAGLEFVQHGFGAVDKAFVVDDRGVEGRDEFEEIGFTFDEVGEKIGIVRGQGVDLVEERLFCLQLLAECAAWVVCHDSLQAARARRDATHRGIAVAPASPDAGNSMWGAGNLQTGAPSGSFVSARTHKLSLFSTASSRSAYHPIATR
jgi:hypothetical protein